ncbi:hypothetical protein KKA15_01720 [Patescibacteria group bacterium]|nr:hypothetical protein [Patescibacteria group bacterium]
MAKQEKSARGGSAPDGQKNKNVVLNDLYNSDNDHSEKTEFSNNVKSRFTKFWQSEHGLPSLVIFIGITAIIFGLWHSKASIRGDFGKTVQVNNNLDLAQTLENQELSQLSQQDTDKDGLSDFDELNVFYTSPYLEDTDSDGKLDMEEIAAKTDPNCPVQTCTASERPYQPAPTQIGQTPQQEITTLDELLNQQTAQLGEQQLDQQNVMEDFSNLSAQEIRQFLLESGMPQDLLQSISDDQLMQVVQETLIQQGL